MRFDLLGYYSRQYSRASVANSVPLLLRHAAESARIAVVQCTVVLTWHTAVCPVSGNAVVLAQRNYSIMVRVLLPTKKNATATVLQLSVHVYDVLRSFDLFFCVALRCNVVCRVVNSWCYLPPRVLIIPCCLIVLVSAAVDGIKATMWQCHFCSSQVVHSCCAVRCWALVCCVVQVAALLSRYLEYVGGKEDDGNAKIIQDSLQVRVLSPSNCFWCSNGPCEL